MTYEIKGQVKDTATDSGAAGVRVEAWDKDLIYDDFLGNAETNANGEFVITFDEYFFRELFIDTWPDIYFKLFFDGEEIANTKDDVLWNVHSQNIHVDLKVKLPPKKKKWTERDIYLKIECIEDYSPVKPMEKFAPPLQYGRDCMRNEGHADGSIPEAEIEARSLKALVFREYLDAGYLIPKTDKLIEADVNEPAYNRRVPGTVIYAHPCERLRIHVWNCDTAPHSFHTHGLHYGIDSDGAYPFGVEDADGRRSDEICSGQTWTYTFEVLESSIGVWPFHTHTGMIAESINRGLFGGIVVLPKNEKLPHKPLVPPSLVDDVLVELKRREGRKKLHANALKPLNKRFLKDQLDFFEEFALKEIIKRPGKPIQTNHVPVFFNLMVGSENKALFDSGDLEELVGIFEYVFAAEGDFEYFCTIHPMMTGTIHVMAGGPANVTVNIVDGPPMAFSPDTITVGVGGTVRWENHSMFHHTVTAKDGASLATHSINGRGFVGNSPTIVAPAGQRIRWYVFNLDVGMNWHNFHTHAMRWQLAGENIDTRSMGPAESFMVESRIPPVLLLSEEIEAIQNPKCRPKDAKLYHLKGDYVFHCHVHHHLMNGMVGLVRSTQKVWLTKAMADELKKQGKLNLDDGKNNCPDVDLDRCNKRGEGKWELIPGAPEVTFMHSVLLPNKEKVLYWGYTKVDQSRLWDYSTPAGAYGVPANQPATLPGHDLNSSNLWSAEHTHLDTPLGEVLVNGGFTPNKTFLFDPLAESWSETNATADNRFYSTTLTLPDGRVITLFGSASKTIEAYTPGVGWAAPVVMPAGFSHHQYYPWTYVLPDGKLIIAGPHDPTHRFNWDAPAGFETFNTVKGNRSTSGEKGSSVMQILRPPSYDPIVLIMGGNVPGTESTAEFIDLSVPAPAWALLPDLNVPRPLQFTATLLPDGRIFIAGGVGGGADGGASEIYDPKNPGDGWQLGPSMTHKRVYHSSFIMLPDGSVVGGGDPQVGAVPTEHERYFPDYFTVPRPSISNAPATINYASNFQIDSPDVANISEVILLRAGSATHGFNMSQRGIECVISGAGVADITVEAPPNANLMPPGWHLLYILDGNRTPSPGRWIRLTA